MILFTRVKLIYIKTKDFSVFIFIKYLFILIFKNLNLYYINYYLIIF